MIIQVAHGQRRIACDFVTCALLRDNVAHHVSTALEEGIACIDAVADIVWAASELRIPCSSLQSELELVWARLEPISIRDLAVSIRTLAALERTLAPPAISGTVLYSRTGWQLPLELDSASTLGQLFEGLVDELLLIMSQPSTDGLLRLTLACSEPPPRRHVGGHASVVHRRR